MALPLDQLIQPLTKEQVQASILRLCASSGLRTTSWQTGGVTLTLIGVVSTFFANFTTLIASANRSGFLDLAEGGYLTLLAYYVYGVDRIEDTYASEVATVTNTGGGLYTFDVGEFIVANPTTKTTYSNTERFTLQPVGLSGAVQTPGFVAQTAGSAGTAAPGTITKVVSSIPGVTVTNDLSFVGVDGESDPALRQRCRDKLGALSPNGPSAAYEYVLKSAVNGSGAPIGINRVKTVPATGTGVVDIYVATPSGPLTTSDLAAAQALVNTQATPDSVTAVVHNSAARSVDVTVSIFADGAPGLAASDVRSLVQTALLAYFPSIPIGGFVLVAGNPGLVLTRGIERACANAVPGAVEAVSVTPASDVVLLVNEVAELGDINIFLGPPS